MGSEIYPEVHENPRAFISSSSPILFEPLAHGSGDWSLPWEDCIIVYLSVSMEAISVVFVKELNKAPDTFDIISKATKLQPN